MVLSKVPPLPFWKYFYTYENETPPKYLMKYTAHQLLQLMDVLSFSSPVLEFSSRSNAQAGDLFFNSLEHKVSQLNQQMDCYFSSSIASK